MGRYQSDHIYEASGAFFVRYYVSAIVDGKATRVQRSYRVCEQGRQIPQPDVQGGEAESRRAHGHRECDAAPVNDQTIAAFWEKTYLPFAEENLRAATVHGYKQIWGQHLSTHFGTIALKDYKTHMGSLFLTSLAKKLGRATIQQIRSLASGIFAHAVNVAVIESNPWHDVKVLGKTKEPAETAHYTPQEAEDIISALVEHVDCRSRILSRTLARRDSRSPLGGHRLRQIRARLALDSDSSCCRPQRHR